MGQDPPIVFVPASEREGVGLGLDRWLQEAEGTLACRPQGNPGIRS